MTRHKMARHACRKKCVKKPEPETDREPEPDDWRGAYIKRRLCELEDTARNYTIEHTKSLREPIPKVCVPPLMNRTMRDIKKGRAARAAEATRQEICRDKMRNKLRNKRLRHSGDDNEAVRRGILMKNMRDKLMKNPQRRYSAPPMMGTVESIKQLRDACNVALAQQELCMEGLCEEDMKAIREELKEKQMRHSVGGSKRKRSKKTKRRPSRSRSKLSKKKIKKTRRRRR